MRILIFFMLIIPVATANAANDSGRQIEQAAERFLKEFATDLKNREYTVSYKVGNLDARFSLAACNALPTVSFSGDPWKTTQPSLLVSCQGEKPWRMFLPVSVEIRGQGLVAARPLARGERLTRSALTQRAIEINSTHRNPIHSAEQLVGMEMRRGVNEGTVFTADLLTAPEAISRGDHVVISAKTGGFSVKSRGKALAGGGIGEQVLVENLSSARKVRARITAPGKVEIPM